MTFIIILIALIIERFFDWGHIRQWGWFIRYQQWLGTRLSGLSAYVLLVISVLPPILIVGVTNHLLSGWLYSILKLFFGVAVLVYCLGPNNFWAQIYSCIGMLRNEEPTTAMARVQTICGVSLPNDSQAFHHAFTKCIFVEANRRIFAVFFWFIVLGPVGAVLYRTIDLCRRGLTTMQVAMQMQRLLDWLPLRVFAFIFALGGHFTGVMQCYRRDFFTSPKANDKLLTDCGVAAVDVLEATRIPEDGSAEQETLALLDRVFIMALAILAVIVLL